MKRDILLALIAWAAARRRPRRQFSVDLGLQLRSGDWLSDLFIVSGSSPPIRP